MLSTPLPQLANRTYIDENALQPGQVKCFTRVLGLNLTYYSGQHLLGLE